MTDLLLLQSFDSLFPIGAFTLSNGMETYVQKEIVKNKKSLENYINTFLSLMPYNDLGFAAWTVKTKNYEMADSLCAASKSPKEIRQGSQKLCRRFIKAQKEICPEKLKMLLEYDKKIQQSTCEGMFPVALGLYFLDINVDLEKALMFYSYSQISTIVNHAVKLIPLGQMEGQKALFNSLGKINEATKKAISITEDELGFGGMGFDLKSMEHEKLYSRLYIS